MTHLSSSCQRNVSIVELMIHCIPLLSPHLQHRLLNLTAWKMFVKLLAAVALTFSCAAASASIDAVTPIHQWATTPLQAEARFTQLSDLAFNSSLCNAVQPPSTATVDVYPDKLLQPIVGFGAALTETTAYNFIKLRDRNQSAYNELLQSLFASSEHGGIGISFLRIPITSCDLSLPTPGWSFDDVDGDVTLQHFNSTHIEAWQIPVLKDIMALTKTHGAAVRLLGLLECSCVDEEFESLGLRTIDRRLVSCLCQLFGQGSQVFRLARIDTLGNYTSERVSIFPLHQQSHSFDSASSRCVVGSVSMLGRSMNQARTRALCTRLTMSPCWLQSWNHWWLRLDFRLTLQRGITTGILSELVNALIRSWFSCVFSCIDTHDECAFLLFKWQEEFPDEVINEAAKYVDYIAWHCYDGDVSNQTVFHNKHPQVPMIFTECSQIGNEGSPRDFLNDFMSNQAGLYHGNLGNWGQSVTHWSMGVDRTGGPHSGGCGDCSGVVVVDAADTTKPYFVKRNSEFYSLAHFSSLIPQNSNVVTNKAQSINALTFTTPDHRRVIQLLNSGTSTVQVVVNDQDIKGACFSVNVAAQSQWSLTYSTASSEDHAMKMSHF